MENVLSPEQVTQLARLLQASGRVSTAYKRRALLEEIGYDPNRLQFDQGAATDFSLVWLGQLNRTGDREMLLRLIQAILPYLPGQRSDLLALQRALTQNRRADTLEPKSCDTVLTRALVKIYDRGRRAIGAGFLVSERRVLTCAHVISDALGLPPGAAPADGVGDHPNAPFALGLSSATASLNDAEVLLNLPLLASQEFFTARVCHWRPDTDVAGLAMTGDGPEGVEAVRLITAEDLWGHPFRACGFPADHGDGVWTSGVLRGRTAAGWLQIDDVKTPGYWVQPGFSGTPVWDERLNGVVGMAVAAETDQSVKAAYIIPADVLAEAWPGVVHVEHGQA